MFLSAAPLEAVRSQSERSIDGARVSKPDEAPQVDDASALSQSAEFIVAVNSTVTLSAVSNGSFTVIATQAGGRCIELPSSDDEITALAWVEISAGCSALVVGHASGVLRVFDSDATLLLMQVLHKALVCSMKEAPLPNG